MAKGMGKLQKEELEEADTERAPIYQEEEGHQPPHHAATNGSWDLWCLQDENRQRQ